IDPLAVDHNVTMAHELARREHRRHELGAVDDGVEPALEQADQPLAGIALGAGGFGVKAVERLLGGRAVITLELLLRLELQAVVGGLALAALAMLAGAIGAVVQRALRAAPEVFPQTAVDL